MEEEDDELDDSDAFESVDFDPSDFSLEPLVAVLVDRDDERLSVR